MSENYRIDDILAEIERKKGGSAFAAPKTPKAAAPANNGASPFNMRGMDDLPEAPAASDRTAVFSVPTVQPDMTRTDIPTARAAASDFSSRTQVIPSIRDDGEADFENQRKAKVQQFMQHSFAAEIEAEPDPEPDDGMNEISQFFGGIKRSGPAAEKPKKKKRPEAAAPKNGRKAAADQKPAKSKGKKSKPLAPVKEKKEKGIKPAPSLRDQYDDSEYNSPSDARDVRDDIFALKKSLTLRVVMTGICCAVLLYLSLANLYPIPLLNAICPEVDMKVYLLVNLMVVVISALFANAVICNGLVSFFKLHADYDAPAALCTLAVISHGVALALNSDAVHTGEGGFYFLIAGMSLFFNSIGKRMMVTRIERNFAVASSAKEMRGEFIIKDKEIAARLAHGQGFSDPTVTYSAPIGFPEKFLKLSYSEEYTENLSRYLSHFFLVAALILALACGLFFDSSAIEAFTIFCAVLCMASPLTPTIIGNLPLLRASKALAPERAFISGYDAVEEFEDMNCVTVNVNELYPKSLIELHGIKPLAESRIDEAILDAVSVSCRIDGLLSDALLNMVGGNRAILLPVDQVSYHDGAGVSAMVNGRQVLIGRRNLMEKFNVALPPPEYEKRFTKGGKKILYIANSGAVTAMLIVSYRPGKKAAAWMHSLGKKQMGLIVYSMNPNITVKKISSDFRYPDEFIRIMPAELQDSYASLTAYRERATGYIVSPPAGSARLHALSAVHSVKQAIVIGSIMQMAGLILGYAATAFLAFSGNIALLGFGKMALYQLFWMAIALLFSNLKKI